MARSARRCDMLKVGGENVDPMEAEGLAGASEVHRSRRRLPDDRLTEVPVMQRATGSSMDEGA